MSTHDTMVVRARELVTVTEIASTVCGLVAICSILFLFSGAPLLAACSVLGMGALALMFRFASVAAYALWRHLLPE